MTMLLVVRSVTHHGGHGAIPHLNASVRTTTGVRVNACFLDGAQPSLVVPRYPCTWLDAEPMPAMFEALR